MTADHAGALIAAIVLGLPAAAYAALRVVKRDSREDSAIAVVERSLTLVEKDRDYWRERAEKERTSAEEVERRVSDRMAREVKHGAEQRAELYRQIEDLRRALHQQGLRTTEGD